MEEKIVTSVMCILYDYCADESYKVIDVADVLLGVEEDLRKKFNFPAFIKELSDMGYINVKLLDDEELCYTVTVRGKRFVEDYRYKELVRQREEEERLRQIALEEERKRREEEERLRQEAIEAENRKREEEERRRQLAIEEENRKREEEERLHKERMAEERRQAALEIERMIEEQKAQLKSAKKQERGELQKALQELESNEAYRELIEKQQLELEQQRLAEQQRLEEERRQYQLQTQSQQPTVMSVQALSPLERKRLLISIGLVSLGGSTLGGLIAILIYAIFS